MKSIDHDRLDRLVLDARKGRDARDAGYRERALKIYPWICGRCAREFTRENLQQADRGYTDAGSTRGGGASHSPFAALKSLLEKGDK